MPEKNEDIFLKVMKTLQKEGALEELVLIGSWCLLFYREHFHKAPQIPAVRTMDMDLLVLYPRKVKKAVNVHGLLEGMGFEAKYQYTTGYCKYRREEFTLEFLMPLRGAGLKAVEEVRPLSINAQGLRYLDFSEKELTRMSYKGCAVRLPKPEAYTLLKFIIHEERKNPEKKIKDLTTAVELGHFLVHRKESRAGLREIFSRMPQKKRTRILRITQEHAEDVYEALREI